jgi:anti-sigma regulatory factor (Ser/Thr protein kinase)
MSSLRCTVDLPLDLTAPGFARALVEAALRQWAVDDDDVLASCAIVVSELVTNALNHAGVAGGVAQLEVAIDDGRVRLSVADPSPLVPRMRVAEDHDVSGRGLSIVDQLSLEWGAEPCELGKLVFAELPATPDGAVFPARQSRA